MVRGFRREFLLSFLGILFVLFFSCKNNTDAGPPPLPEKNLSFSQHIRPIFLDYCANAPGCHRAQDAAGGLDLESPFPTLIGNSGKVVIPGDPEHSLLFQVLISNVGDIPRMPLNRPPLGESYIRAIETWIAEGAKINN